MDGSDERVGDPQDDPPDGQVGWTRETAARWAPEWLEVHAARSRALLLDFVSQQAADHLMAPGATVLDAAVADTISKSDMATSTLAYLGWLSTRSESQAAAAATAALELLTLASAIQREPAERRAGDPGVQVEVTRWARARVERPGTFGRSATVVLGDLCLVWANQMFEEAGLPASLIDPARPIFEQLRANLVLGQLHDLYFSDLQPSVTLSADQIGLGVPAVAGPLQFGAALAGCTPSTRDVLRQCGVALGQAMRLRSDLVRLPEDLRRGRMSTTIAMAYEYADAELVRRISCLPVTPLVRAGERELWVRQWNHILETTETIARIETLIADRLQEVRFCLGVLPDLPALPRAALHVLADRVA